MNDGPPEIRREGRVLEAQGFIDQGGIQVRRLHATQRTTIGGEGVEEMPCGSIIAAKQDADDANLTVHTVKYPQTTEASSSDITLS